MDVSGLDGIEHLEDGRAITTEDLKRAYDIAEINPQKGDMVCLNTGWGKYFMSNNEKYLAGEPGLDLNVAHWLTKQDTIAIGADNMAVEVLPSTNHPEIMMPAHQHCLAEAGFHLVENLNLLGLIQDGISEFCLIMLPIKLKGTTGCPVRPIAVI